MSALLVDTHALLWWLADDPELSEAARAEIADPGNEVLVSAATVWEIAIKRALGKLRAPDGLLAYIEAEGFGWLEVSAAHAWEVSTLPDHRGDPFDRLLIAQALVERLPLVSSDEQVGRYGVELRW